MATTKQNTTTNNAIISINSRLVFKAAMLCGSQVDKHKLLKRSAPKRTQRNDITGKRQSLRAKHQILKR